MYTVIWSFFSVHHCLSTSNLSINRLATSGIVETSWFYMLSKSHNIAYIILYNILCRSLARNGKGKPRQVPLENASLVLLNAGSWQELGIPGAFEVAQSISKLCFLYLPLSAHIPGHLIWGHHYPDYDPNCHRFGIVRQTTMVGDPCNP